MDETDDTLKLHRDLIIACGWGKEVDVILLLQQGASVRVQDQDGKNCLHYAACKGHIQVTNLLIENGCNINARDKSDRTPLHLAAEEGHHDIVSILLDKNAEFNVQDEEGNSPCHVACLNDYFEVVELLIHVRGDLNIKNKDGFTPLHIASIHHHVKSMSLLLKAGVNKSAQDYNGNTALHMAAQTKSSKAFKCLVKYGADINIQNHDGDTPLHLCANSGNAQFVEYLLDSDQPVQLSTNNVGDTAKDIAIRHGFKEIVQLIPDPSKKKKMPIERRKCCSAESLSSSRCEAGHNVHSPTLLYSQKSDESPKENNNKVTATNQEHNPTAYLHPPEEIATSSSVLSLFVPTTDSGISLPMDVRGDHTPVTSLQRRKSNKPKTEKPNLFDELQQYDSHRKEKSSTNSKASSKKGEMFTHEYKELRYDPRFMSPQVTPKIRSSGKSHKVHGVSSSRRYSDNFIDSGAISDESIQAKGCFFKTKSKKTRSSMKAPKHLSAEAEKELMIHRQAELQYQLNISKLSLEKQMRKMRKKFERALQATDERFLEQKKREESFHYQLRNELEVIEQSLERGSKKNVEEFTNHIKTELNNLAERLIKNDDSQSDEFGSPVKRLHKRESAVDLDKDISVSLKRNDSPTKTSKKRRQANSSTKTENEQSLIRAYEERVKILEKEAQIKQSKERENEELRARVLELERIVLASSKPT